MRRPHKGIHIATFRVEVTPPAGSPLCGGLVSPVAGVADPLYAVGAVLLGKDAPVVLCAVDWCEMNNVAHAAWREELARAVGSRPDRVAVHTVHQHNAPIVDRRAQELVAAAPGLPNLMDTSHERESLERVAAAARASLRSAQAVTHIATGSARVSEVASARRILGADGKIRATRWSSCRDEALRAEPEGLVDPVLRTVRFLRDGASVATLHYYATHPMSYYGDGIVSSDFAGLARERRRAESEGERLYFTGCGGNVTAGKYNDGSPELRVILTDRMERAMRQSEAELRVVPLSSFEWRSREVLLPPRGDLLRPALASVIADTTKSAAERITAALRLAYLDRASTPLTLSCLRLGSEAAILHLPGEAFVEYQLFAVAQAGLVAVAAYGDTGTGYIPLEKSYAEGGYEPGASSVSGAAEALIKGSILDLLKA